MAVVFKVNTTDRTSEIDRRTFVLNRALTNQVDTCTFMVRRPNSSGIKFALLDDVEVIEDGVTIFGGQIVDVSEGVDGMLEYVQYTAKDYAFDMDRILVIESYENMSVEAIIADIVTNFLPAGYTTTNVSAPFVVQYIAFNYEYPSKCLQQLADIAGCDWYVDENKNIYFFVAGSSAAPFGLTDTNQKYIYNTLKIKKDVTNMRNSIIVRGGEYQGDTYTEEQEADGDTVNFLQAYKYANIVVEVNGSGKTIGIDFIDDPASFDVLYNFQEKTVKFRDDNKPTAGQIVSITGNPYIPVITKLQNLPSIAEFGEFQYKVVDSSIASREAARDRARAEITKWAQEVNEGSFDTYSTGLKVGHKINISSTIRSISADYIISRITSKMDTASRLKHSVILVSSQTYGMVEFLQKLLIQKDKEIKIAADEVLDSVIGLTESFAITDVVGTPTHTSPPYRYGAGTNVGKWNFATWS